MGIVIIDYRMGNLGSIVNMLNRIGVEATLTHDLAAIERADKLILPGVGAFDRGMDNLHKLGVIPLLNEMVLTRHTPILGLCLGMQLFTRSSEEGQLPGLGWIDGECRRFYFESTDLPPAAHSLKVPHMGWNNLRTCRDHFLLNGLDEQARFYFVHSYYVQCNNPHDELARSRYGYEFTCALHHDAIIGLQFHPEKSLRWGMYILKRFAEYVSG